MNVGCPVRRTVMTFCFCLRFMLEPSSCLASLQTRSLNIWAVMKPSDRGGTTSVMPSLQESALRMTAFLRFSHRFLGLDVHSLRILSLVCAFFARFSLIRPLSPCLPLIPTMSGVCVHSLITSFLLPSPHSDIGDFYDDYLLDASIFSIVDPGHIK